MSIRITKKITPKVLVFYLIFLFYQGAAARGNTAGVVIKTLAENLTAAVSEYHNGSYEKAINRLEPVLREGEEIDPKSRAKIYLLLGACYEKLGREKIAEAYFLELKEMLDKEMFLEHPVIEGIEPGDFSQYRKVFPRTSFFTFKEPVPVSDMLEKKVIHAPRKTIEEKEKEKKKKKLPLLLILGGFVIAGVVAVLLISRKNRAEPTFQEIEWLRIPAGEFLMGDNFNEGESDEQPVHKVYLDEYHISKYEITYEQYSFFCARTGRVKPFEIDAEYYALRRRPFPVNIPMHYVSWNDARAFCDWLSKRTGKNVHLPTEAQWEKAARGTGQYRYPWGNNEPTCDLALYSGCSVNIDGSFHSLMPVGSYPAGESPYGVQNMAGSVREWCLDWYDPAYYANSPQKNPSGPTGGTYRVIRGGGRYSKKLYLRSADRHYAAPNSDEGALGFRVVMEEN